MTFDALGSFLPGVVLRRIETADRQETIAVEADRVVDVCRTLRDQPELGFIFLADITAADFWPREPRFEVVYHLASAAARLRLKVNVAGSPAHVPTVQSVWPAAGWLEREVWDMFGIEFDGHGDLRRLLMPEDWEGYPLRKDFPVQIRLKPRSSEALQITEEEFRANLANDRAARAGGVEQGH
jgi:NADH-quinone oxidoreductase subunit C